MYKKRITLILVLVLVLTMSLAGCTEESEGLNPEGTGQTEESPGTESIENEGSGVFREATGSKVSSLNPHTYTSSYQSSVLGRTGAKLYAYLPNTDFTSYVLAGELADGQPIDKNGDGKTWTIKLKDNLVWANGDTLDADDIIYTWKALLDPSLVLPRGGSFASDYITIDNANEYYLQADSTEEILWEEVGLKKIDNLTLEVQTVERQSVDEVMNHFAHPANTIVYDVMYEENMNSDRTETLYGTDKDKYMSAGKFTIEDWIQDALVVYKKNPLYVYSDSIKLAGIETKVVEDDGTQMQLFESGQIDVIDLSAEDYLNYEEDPRVLYSPSSAVRSITFNTINPEKPILANLNFRKAMYYSMNREVMSNLGKTEPANYFVSTRPVIDPVTGLRYRDTERANENVTPNLGYNPSLAKEYFDKALQEENLESIELTIMYNDTDFYKSMSEYVQKSVPEILGEDRISFNLQAMPTSQLNALKKTFNETPNVYEITWSAWAGNELAPWNAMKFWTSSYPRKNEPFYNEEFDRLFDEANYGESRFEEGKRLEYTAEMERILLEELPFVPICHGITKTLKSERIKLAFPEWVNKIGFGWEYSKIVE